MAGRSPQVVFHVLEITLISAQDLKPPSNSAMAASQPRMKTYAVVWNPTWNEKFLFRVPAGFLIGDSPSAVHVEIYAVGRLVDSLVGAVRFLVGNERLLSRPLGEPSFAAVGIRRPSGRFRGVLNIGSAILPVRHVSTVAEEAIARSGGDATGYRVLMGDGLKIRRPPPVVLPPPPRALRERNKGREQGPGAAGKGKRENGKGGGGLCGLGFQRRNLPEPADQNSSPAESAAGGGSPSN
ncbi:unnamed protein product [Spirodela intermedia]|uniref:C2 domain-containing protein n=1 Tax=Spirodela intermedia TaxID=51605 RepID=A0A7I8JP90_SPIIN|nr:unnamed protein product [Spirodela intermedia]CAA6671585.1 unnamed protein product [Spirodela intermedia]